MENNRRQGGYPPARRRRRSAKRRRQILRNRLIALVIVLLFFFLVYKGVTALLGLGKKTDAAASSASASSEAASEAEPEVQQVFIPAWDTAGLEDYPYLVAVNRQENTVTVYEKDDEGNYTVPLKAMVCSTGDDTPAGSFNTTDQYVWRELTGGVYGQYATRITEDILFHSVPYEAESKDTLEYEEFNKLGTAASLGCVRLQVKDCKWIYDECPSGTPVVIYDDDDPGPLGKPDFEKIDPESENRGWDPTDPDEDNPWFSEDDEEQQAA